MAGFKTHITTSTILGIGYGAGAFGYYHLPATTCVLAGGLCGVSGMLPDLDSGPGRPLRESMAFAAAVVPMAMVDRFRAMGLDLESIVLLGGAIYLLIRFGMAALMRHYSVHRGMFHSLPAAAIAAEVVFLVFEKDQTMLRYFVAGAVLLGFMSHLILDEIWSIEFRRGLPHLKSSFGTAMKFWGPAMGPNILTYALLAAITFFAVNDPTWMSKVNGWAGGPESLAKRALDHFGFNSDSSPSPNPAPQATMYPTNTGYSNATNYAPSDNANNMPPMMNINGTMRPVDTSRR
ncbi:MAG TPA: metal-dependent hydrolase [Pirellulales bacterium]|jgi:membrane-bound metal-dependent hydrolase YbcI (DUF457 family)